MSAAKTRDLRSALPHVNYLLVDIGRHGWPRSGAMLTERFRKLSSNLIDAHVLDVPTLDQTSPLTFRIVTGKFATCIGCRERRATRDVISSAKGGRCSLESADSFPAN